MKTLSRSLGSGSTYKENRDQAMMMCLLNMVPKTAVKDTCLLLAQKSPYSVLMRHYIVSGGFPRAPLAAKSRPKTCPEPMLAVEGSRVEINIKETP